MTMPDPSSDDHAPPRLDHPRLLITLVVIAVLGVIYVAASVLIPVVLGLLLGLLFRPLVRKLETWRIGPMISAAAITLAIIALLVIAATAGGGQATQFIDDIPGLIEKVREQLIAVVETTEAAGLEPQVEQSREQQGEAREAVRAVHQAAQTDAQTQTPALAQSQAQTQSEAEAQTQERRRVLGAQVSAVAMTVFSQAATVLVGLVVALGVMFFLLASGDLFLIKLMRMLPRFGDKKEAVVAAREMESDLSTYLVTVAAINTGLALVTFVPLWLMGMPNAWMWAALAGLLNFVPYIGPIFYLVLLTLAAISAFDSFWYALIAPVSFQVANLFEGYAITPTLMGKRFSMPPLIVFGWLVFWGWVWGLAGALLAVPMLVCFRIMCGHIEPLRPIGFFLSDAPAGQYEDPRHDEHEQAAQQVTEQVVETQANHAREDS